MWVEPVNWYELFMGGANDEWLIIIEINLVT